MALDIAEAPPKKKTLALRDVRANQKIRVYIEKANEQMAAIGFTEHGLRHAALVAAIARNACNSLELGPRVAELASIAGYYRRVTTEARPMNRLIAAVMLATLAALAAQIAEAHGRGWAPWLSLALAGAPILLAACHTVPCAVRLGRSSDAPERQGALARSILRDHVLCFASIVALIVVQLAAQGLP